MVRTEHVRQRLSCDCVVAAVAMFTELTYEEVLVHARKYFHHRYGTISRTGELLGDLGFSQENLISDSKPDGREFRSLWLYEYYLSPNILRDYLWGREALMSVPSLNREEGSHMIYYDGHQIHDPQMGRRGKKFYAPDDFKVLMPTGAYVWRAE